MNDQELQERIDELVAIANDPDTPKGHMLECAAKAETFNRIKNGTLLFGGPREALEARKSIESDGMEQQLNGPRIEALKEYLDE